MNGNQGSNGNGRPAADVAIVGMACRFPGADDYHQYWHNLRGGRCSVGPLPRDRWDPGRHDYRQHTPNAAQARSDSRSQGRQLGSIGDIARFDREFFSISEREAAVMDPQHRVLLEEAWHAIEDAGIPLAELQRETTSTFIGMSSVDYLQSMESADVDIELHNQYGNYLCGASNRISHLFGLRGKSVTVDTACASSLVVLHEARKALMAGECDYALVAAVKVLVHPFQQVSFHQARLLSPAGACRPYAADAGGFVSGEGVGVVLLQRLPEALSQRTHVYAVIRGSAVNHSAGRASAISAPSVGAQEDVIAAAYDDAGISPASVSYVEGHSVGTAIGDAIEIGALSHVFQPASRRAKAAHGATANENGAEKTCKIGSVKGNIGHLDTAAGMSGLIKVLLMLEHRRLVPSLHASEVSPLIDFASTPFALATSDEPWLSADDRPLRAGVSAVGFTGTNAHVILEEAPSQDHADTVHDAAATGAELFILSAKTREAFDRQVGQWRDFLATPGFAAAEVGDICRTQTRSRHGGSYRWAALVKDKGELLDAVGSGLIQPKHQTGAIRAHFADAGWSGFAEIGDYAGDCPVLRVCWTEMAAALDDWRPGSGERFFQPTWADNERGPFRVAADCAIFFALERAGAEIGLISCAGAGMPAGLWAAGILDAAGALTLASGQATADDIAWQRPRHRFYDAVHGRVIAPIRFAPEYGETLLANASAQGDARVWDGEMARVFALSSHLFHTQYSYKRFILEWGRHLKPHGVQISALAGNRSDAEAFTAASKRRHCLLMHMMLSALGAFAQKWELRALGALSNSPGMQALHTWLSAGILGRRELVAWLMDDAASFADVVRDVSLLGSQPGAEFLAIHGHGLAPLSELGDKAAWVEAAEAASSRDDGYNGPEALPAVVWSGGRVVVTDEQGQMRQSQLQQKNFGDGPYHLGLLAELWTLGHEIAWADVLAQRDYRKIRLPTYPFGGDRHWFQPLPEEQQEIAQQPELDRAALESLSHRELTELYDRLHRAEPAALAAESM